MGAERGATKQEEVSTENSAQYEKKPLLERKFWQILFKVLLSGFAIWGIHNLAILYQFHTDPQYASIPKFSLMDFKISLLFVVIFHCLKKGLARMMDGWIRRNFDLDKFDTEEEKNERVQKAYKWFWSAIYYSCSTVTAYILFKDEYFFPKMLGGSADCSAIFQYTPAAPDIPYGKLFYMVQFGSHLHTLIAYAIEKFNDPKFWEMFLHHGVAVFLIFFSYMSNEIAVGILVLFVHDPSDIFLDGGRFYNDLKNRKDWIRNIFAVCFVTTWIYFRLYSFPVCVIGTALTKAHSQDWGIMASPYAYLITMLSALVGLHTYWFAFILRATGNMFKKKKEINDYDNKAKRN